MAFSHSLEGTTFAVATVRGPRGRSKVHQFHEEAAMDPSKPNASGTPASGAAIQRRVATLARSLTALWAVATLAAGCGVGADPSAPAAVGTTTQASVATPQTLLDGNSIPKFVDPLPTFNGRRINGSATLNVSM